MRRTTVFADDEVIGALQAIARRGGVTLSEITREVLAAYVSRNARKRKPLALIGIGRSGHSDIAARTEELFQEGVEK